MKVLDFSEVEELVAQVVFRRLLVNVGDEQDPTLDGCKDTTRYISTSVHSRHVALQTLLTSLRTRSVFFHVHRIIIVDFDFCNA